MAGLAALLPASSEPANGDHFGIFSSLKLKG